MTPYRSNFDLTLRVDLNNNLGNQTIQTEESSKVFMYSSTSPYNQRCTHIHTRYSTLHRPTMATVMDPQTPVSPTGHADASATTATDLTSTEPAEAQVDLEAYDEEQVRLMEERCILVDDQDKAYGEGSKKRCESEGGAQLWRCVVDH